MVYEIIEKKNGYEVLRNKSRDVFYDEEKMCYHNISFGRDMKPIMDKIVDFFNEMSILMTKFGFDFTPIQYKDENGVNKHGFRYIDGKTYNMFKLIRRDSDVVEIIKILVNGGMI